MTSSIQHGRLFHALHQSDSAKHQNEATSPRPTAFTTESLQKPEREELLSVYTARRMITGRKAARLTKPWSSVGSISRKISCATTVRELDTPGKSAEVEAVLSATQDITPTYVTGIPTPYSLSSHHWKSSHSPRLSLSRFRTSPFGPSWTQAPEEISFLGRR